MNCHTIKGGMVMKRKMKAVAALSLAAVMLLAGCGSSNGTQDGGSAAAADTDPW